LSEIIATEEEHKWSDKDLLYAVSTVKTIDTIRLRRRLNATQDALIADLLADLPTARLTADLPASLPATSAPKAPATPAPATSAPLSPAATIHYKPTEQHDQQLSHRDYGKEAATVAKLYNDDQKYTGVDDSFDFKLSIFVDICKRASLPPKGYITAFPSMLKGLAEGHYYTCSLCNCTFETACGNIRLFFEGPEFNRKNLVQWNTITLQTYIDNNPGKPILQCFRMMLDRLLILQHGIDREFRTPRILANKIVTACQGVPATRIAISDPTEELTPLVSKIQSSIVA